MLTIIIQFSRLFAILNHTINGIDAWIQKTHWIEYFFDFALIYPNGRLRKKARIEAVIYG
jgi:hypothetical protein